MRLLELFGGNRSVGKVAEKLGFTIISLDFKNADLIITFEVECSDSPYKNLV